MGLCLITRVPSAPSCLHGQYFNPVWPCLSTQQPHQVLPEFPSVCTRPAPSSLAFWGFLSWGHRCSSFAPLPSSSPSTEKAAQPWMHLEQVFCGDRKGVVCVFTLVEHLVYVRHYSKSIKGVKSLIPSKTLWPLGYGSAFINGQTES